MAIDGDLDRWAIRFPTSLVPQIIRLVLDSWNNFSTSQVHEVPITQEFFVVLERNQGFSKLPFLPDLEVILPNENGTEQNGRLDLRFIHVTVEKCISRLNVNVLELTHPVVLNP